MAAATMIGAAAQFSITYNLTSTIPRTRNHAITETRSTLRNGRTRLRKLQLTKSSSSDVSTGATTSEAPETKDPVEVAKEMPSLLSALNVEKALRGIAITDVDHYGILGLPRGCSYDQVEPAYNNKVEELMNRSLEPEELNNNLELLKASFGILSSPAERRLYDWSLARSERPEEYMWPFELDSTPASTEPPPAQDPEDVGPTRLVGYFFLGWLVLSFALSVGLNL